MDQPTLPPRLSWALERALLALGGIVLCAPLSLGVLFWWVPTLWPGATWLHDTTLAGVVPPRPTPWSWPALLHARYQQGLEQSFDGNFPGRELLIRLANEGWLRVFDSPGMVEAEPLSVGSDRTLFQTNDVKSYCLALPLTYSLEGFARGLDRLQAECRRRGRAFAVLISPSKAATEPEKLPRVWRDRYEPGPRAPEVFRRTLAAHGIVCVDGQALTLQAEASAPAPPIARGAMHWNPQTALRSGNALLAALRQQGKPTVPMEAETVRVSDDPHGRETDLLDLMNLAVPWHYPAVTLSLRRTPTPAQAGLNAVFVGTSFTEGLAEILVQSGQFAEVDLYFYYHDGKRVFVPAGGSPRFPLPAPDLEREVSSADALIIEINEAMLAQPTFALEFVADALRWLDRPPPDAGEPVPAPDAQSYVWGEEIRFHAGDRRAIERPALTGFSADEPDGTWTDGPSAVVRLEAPPPEGDMLLEANVGACADPALHVKQDVEVFVNDKFVGRWEFSTSAFVRRQVVVPRRLLRGTRHVLRFEVAHPVSPAELGTGVDTRRLGVRFVSLRLRPTAAGP